MKFWPYLVVGTSAEEIKKYCVEDVCGRGWQDFRLSMKGQSTESKLDMLQRWRAKYDDRVLGVDVPRDVQVQIDNYVNALLRGGQLIRAGGGQILVQR